MEQKAEKASRGVPASRGGMNIPEIKKFLSEKQIAFNRKSSRKELNQLLKKYLDSKKVKKKANQKQEEKSCQVQNTKINEETKKINTRQRFPTAINFVIFDFLPLYLLLEKVKKKIFPDLGTQKWLKRFETEFQVIMTVEEYQKDFELFQNTHSDPDLCFRLPNKDLTKNLFQQTNKKTKRVKSLLIEPIDYWIWKFTSLGGVCRYSYRYNNNSWQLLKNSLYSDPEIFRFYLPIFEQTWLQIKDDKSAADMFKNLIDLSERKNIKGLSEITKYKKHKTNSFMQFVDLKTVDFTTAKRFIPQKMDLLSRIEFHRFKTIQEETEFKQKLFDSDIKIKTDPENYFYDLESYFFTALSNDLYEESKFILDTFEEFYSADFYRLGSLNRFYHFPVANNNLKLLQLLSEKFEFSDEVPDFEFFFIYSVIHCQQEENKKKENKCEMTELLYQLYSYEPDLHDSFHLFNVKEQNIFLSYYKTKKGPYFHDQYYQLLDGAVQRNNRRLIDEIIETKDFELLEMLLESAVAHGKEALVTQLQTFVTVKKSILKQAVESSSVKNFKYFFSLFPDLTIKDKSDLLNYAARYNKTSNFVICRFLINQGARLLNYNDLYYKIRASLGYPEKLVLLEQQFYHSTNT